VAAVRNGMTLRLVNPRTRFRPIKALIAKKCPSIDQESSSLKLSLSRLEKWVRADKALRELRKEKVRRSRHF
jgi:hypothetical protein